MVCYGLSLTANPVTQRIAPSLEASTHIGVEPGALRDFNLLVISMDTTRADHLRSYGHLGIETPNLDGLARNGVLFSQAITPSPSTLPAHSALMTGLYPIHHGARANGTFRLSDEVDTLAETLRAAGYRTGAAISAFVLDRRFGLLQGFEAYDDDLRHGVKHSPHMFRERPAELTNEAVFAWLDALGPDERFFYWVHYFDPHAAYLPPEPYREQYAHDRYSGEISYGDAQIGKLLEKLEALGVRDRTLVVFVADHGEGLGEHGEVTHAMLVYDATLRVPMIFSAAPPFPQGKVVHGQVSLIDVMPTALDLLGIASPPRLDGRSLRTPPPDGPRPLYIENLSTQVLHGWAPLLGVRRDDYKFIHAPKPEIYDLRNDPEELENLYDSRPVLAAEMQAQLRAFVGDDPYMGTAAEQNLPMDPETEEMLRSLGYVFTSKAAAQATPDSYQLDPKDMVIHWEKVQAAVHQHMQGQVAESIRAFEQALAEVPDDIWARHVLASAYQTYGEYQKAYEMVASIERRQPDDAATVTSVGRALISLGRLEEAQAKLERALELDPRSGPARIGLAQIARRRRDDERALALLREAIEVDPGSSGPAAYVAIGRLKLRRHELEAAREAFRAALEIDRMNAAAYDGLANVLLEEGRPDAALPHLRSALRFQPAQPATLTTLAQIHRDRGDLERSIELSERALEMSPKFAPAYNNLGRVYRMRGDDETALVMYGRAIEYNAHFDAPYVNRAQLLLSMGREDEAIAAFGEAARLNPANYIALANLGVRAFKDGELERATRFFERALRVREDYALAHKYLGLLHAERDEPAASVRHLERSLELDQGQPEVEKMRFLLGEMRERGETKERAPHRS